MLVPNRKFFKALIDRKLPQKGWKIEVLDKEGRVLGYRDNVRCCFVERLKAYSFLIYTDSHSPPDISIDIKKDGTMGNLRVSHKDMVFLREYKLDLKKGDTYNLNRLVIRLPDMIEERVPVVVAL